MAGANRNEGRLFCQRVDPTGSNACFRYLLITVCRSEQQANRSISHGERSERCRAPSVCFATFVGMLSRVNVCLSACDSQRQLTTAIDVTVHCLSLTGSSSFCFAAGVCACDSGQLAELSFRTVCLSACDSGRLVATFACLRLGSRALLDA